MKPKGRRIAIAAVVLGLATIAAAAFTLRGRILEEWNIHRLKTEDREVQRQALEWLSAHGEEASLGAILDFLCTPDSEVSGVGGNGISRHYMDAILALKAIEAVSSRLNPVRRNAVTAKLLHAKPRVVVFWARGLLKSGPGPQDDLAIRRLRECLSDPDPVVRAGAAYGLSEAGERARAQVPALLPLKNDAHQNVREAAAEAIKRLSAVPGGEDSTR